MKSNAVVLKTNSYGLILYLDPEIPFDELRVEVREKFRTAAGFFKNATLALTFRGRALTQQQESALVGEIVENSKIQIVCIVDENKESEDYYKEAVLRSIEKQKYDEGQFYRGTLRSGQILKTDSSIVIVGDVNPGAHVIANGNIVILGCCMGDIHAGASGNPDCFAAALTMKPIQAKIAGKAARSAIVKKTDTGEYAIDPKIIYIKEDRLQIKQINHEALEEYLTAERNKE